MTKQDHDCGNENDYLVQYYGDGKWCLDDDYDVHVPITYCPFCGKNLGSPMVQTLCGPDIDLSTMVDETTPRLTFIWDANAKCYFDDSGTPGNLAGPPPTHKLQIYPYHDCKGTPGYPCEICGKELPKLEVK